jgi:hypothetical protein
MGGFNRKSLFPGGRPYASELVRTSRNMAGSFWGAGTNPDVSSIRQPLERLGCHTLQRQGQ